MLGSETGLLVEDRGVVTCHTSEVPQGLVLCLILFLIYVNGLENILKLITSQFAGDTKVTGRTLATKNIIQDLNKVIQY